MADRITRNWRNWNGKNTSSQQAKQSERLHSSGSDGDGGGNETSPVAFNIKFQTKKSYAPSRSKVNTGMCNVKSKYNFSKYLKIVNKGINSYIGAGSFKESFMKGNQRSRYMSWSDHTHEDYNLNDTTVKKHFELDMKVLQKRRLANSLAVAVSKIADDRAGEPTIGDEYWSVPELLNRVVSKQQLSSCRETREREKIIIILDTSPSCRRQSAFYMDVAKSSCGLNDLEMYDAPNGFIVKEYISKLNIFNTIPKDICSVFSEWQMFKNRTIIFFGDYDGHRIVNESVRHNNIYWFNPTHQSNDVDYNRYKKKFVGHGGNMYKCTRETEFMKIVRKMR